MDMSFGNIIVTIFMTYYTLYFIRLFRKGFRKGIQITNRELDKLRMIPIKTVEEQKKFIDLKHPKRVKGKFRWISVPKFILQMVVFIAIFQAYNYVINILYLNIAIWVAILFVIIVPILINIILGKFNLEKSDLRIFWRRQK